MSNPINNDLNDFLKNRKQEELDDFEREALEGFDMLESESEAADLKNSLDDRIYKEVFFKEEKKRGGIYWFAAAGLVLVIGLTTYFVLNNSDKITGHDVAVINTAGETSKEGKIQDLTPPAETPKLKERNLEEKTIESEPKQVAEDLKVAKAEKTEIQKDESSLSDDLNSSGPGNGSLKSRSIPMKTAGETEKKATTSNEQSNTRETISNPTPLEEKSVLDESGKKEIKAADAKGEAYDKLAATESVNTTPAYSGAVQPDANKNTELKSVERKKSKNKLKSVFKESKAPATKPQDARYENDADMNQKDLAKNDQESNTGSTTTKNNNSANTPASPVSVTSNENQCYYKGGETTLVEDIRKELKAKNIDKKFDAVLFVNQNKTVTMVNFLNSYDLTTTEKTKVTEILKSLTRFDFYINPTTKTLFEYKVNYRP